MNRKLIYLVSTLMFLAATSMWAADRLKDEARLNKSGMILHDILGPDKVPHGLLARADCVVVFPSVKKAAFIIGASYGRGAMTCRTGKYFEGPWGAPTMMAIEGGSIGLQGGGQSTDFVLLVMNDRGANAILSSKVKLGGDMSAAAGPVGRDASAETDVTLRAKILSYSRARGLFAGVSLAGSTIRPDNSANEKIYGRKIPAKTIALSGTTRVPRSAKELISTLNARTPKHLAMK